MWIYGRTRLAAAAAAGVGDGARRRRHRRRAVRSRRPLAPAGGAAGTAATAPAARSATSRSARRGSTGSPPSTPVFVNLTAAWCITCLVNERAALDRDAVRRAFAERRIVALKGDWTRQDPEITAFLQKFGRSGVPLYLLYDRTGTPTVLPQILSEASVLAALEKI